jgi:cytochrome c oxidase cbb3-type subunit IV
MEYLNDMRAAMTVIAFLTFLGIVYWAYSGRRKKRFEDAAQLPFTEDDDSAAGRGKERSGQ